MMNTQDNLLKDEADMCSFCEDDMENMCSNKEYDTCGDYCGTTAARYVEVLEFTHFVTMFEFDGKGENYKNKHLIDRITVSVVLDLGCGNTTDEDV